MPENTAVSLFSVVTFLARRAKICSLHITADKHTVESIPYTCAAVFLILSWQRITWPMLLCLSILANVGLSEAWRSVFCRTFMLLQFSCLSAGWNVTGWKFHFHTVTAGIEEEVYIYTVFLSIWVALLTQSLLCQNTCGTRHNKWQICTNCDQKQCISVSFAPSLSSICS